MADEDLRGMSDTELYKYMAMQNDGSWRYIAVINELRRRSEFHSLTIAWVAVGISLTSVVLSLTFHFTK